MAAPKINIFPPLIGFVFGALFVYCLFVRVHPQKAAERVTIVERVDTVVITQVEEVERRSEVVRIDTIWVETPAETIRVEVPITRKVFADSSFYAVVSGYQPRLDSMVVFPRTITRTIEHTQSQSFRSRFRFGVGAQVGYGITPRGPQPYVGAGITFGYTF